MNPLYFSGLVTGIGIGLALFGVVTFLVIKLDLKAGLLAKAGKYVPALLVVLLGGFLLMSGGAARADTPVPLTIPTNVIFSSANDWITTFAPIAAIGIGISIALAVLGYLGSMVVKAFHN